MQTSKLRPGLNLIAASHNILRTVTVNSANVYENVEQNLKTWKDIPGPSSLPIIGQLRHFLPGGSLYGSNAKEIQEHLFKKYGPVVKLDGLLGAPTLLFIYDANAIAQIYRGENILPERPALKSLEHYRKKLSRNNEESIDKPTGLLTEHHDVWRKLRTTVNPIMLKPKTIKLYSNIIDDVALDMVARLRSLRDEKNMIQSKFDTEMNLWALESIGIVALGGRLNCLDPNLPQDSPAKRLIQVVHDVFNIIEKLEFKLSLWRYMTTPTFKKAMNVFEELEMLSKHFITKAKEQFLSKNKKSDDEMAILEKLMEIDENVAVAMANDMLLAGVDTTSNTMTGILYLLATNPEKQKKLREEIMSKQERRPYLRACIKEAMRIRPVARGNMRKISKDYNVMGYVIPKDMYVIFAQEQLSTMENQFPRPLEYIPERWLAEKDDPLYHGNADPFAFMPFGFGIRTCIGRRIVELELETFLARVIENFHVGWFGPPLKINATLLNYTAPPYNFTFKDVNSTC